MTLLRKPGLASVVIEWQAECEDGSFPSEERGKLEIALDFYG